MSKLFKLKKWLTVPDAAEHLGIAFGEKVTESDVFRFALDGDLKLSIYLVNGAFGSRCVQVNLEDIEWDEIQSFEVGKTLKIPKNGRVWQDEKGIFQVQRQITQLDEAVFDLPMTGGERIDVEHRYLVLTGGPERTAVSLDGVCIESEDGELFEVQTMSESKTADSWKTPFLQPDKFHPAGALPEDCVFVVRTEAIAAFMKAVNGGVSSDDKPLSTTERNTLLCIIAALCKEAKMDYKTHAKTAGLIQKTAAEMAVSIGETTIEGHLKKIPNALATRMK